MLSLLCTLLLLGILCVFRNRISMENRSIRIVRGIFKLVSIHAIRHSLHPFLPVCGVVEITHLILYVRFPLLTYRIVIELVHHWTITRSLLLRSFFCRSRWDLHTWGNCHGRVIINLLEGIGVIVLLDINRGIEYYIIVHSRRFGHSFGCFI